MNLQFDTLGDVQVVRVMEKRLVFQTLGDFVDQVSQLIEGGKKNLLIDLSHVEYLDSASIGGLVDLHRKTSERTGSLKLVGLQDRVERMVSLVGVHNLIDIFREEQSALQSF